MNRFVIADPKNCIGCRSCEVACVMAHNDGFHPITADNFLPRVKVIKIEKVRTAVMCRQCEDAPCANVCPNGAIERSKESIQVIQEKCIGCKTCVVACPFGAINVVTTQHNEGGSGTDASALKCDLCEGLEHGPACVGACPSNALQLVSRDSLQALRRQRQLQTAMNEESGMLFSYKSVTAAAAKAKLVPSKERIEMNKTPARVDPNKKPIEIRKAQFVEIYNGFTPVQAKSQATRCLTCGDHSFCEWTCPLHNRIPHWLKLVSEGRILEAVELSHQTNTLPEVTGRVCPQDRLCEGSCTLGNEYGSVTVGNIERYITDKAFEMGWKPDLSHVVPTNKRVALIGAGPASLACADILTRSGIKPVIYDRHPEIGGLLTFGIPAFKLEKEILTKRRQIFTDMGMEFHLNTEVGVDVTMDQLMDEYDAVFVGVGTYDSMRGGLENEDAPGVFAALPFLIANTKHLMGFPDSPEEPYINMEGKRVVVLGGGDTAMDCLRTSIRHGAESVICAYRRDEANMPGSKKEVKNSREEGVEFMFNLQPLFIELDKEGHVSGIRMVRTEMGEPDAAGRRRPRPIEGSEFTLEADAVIMAFGFNAHKMPWLEPYDVELDKWGGIVADVTKEIPGQTSNPKIFAAGDVVRGADLVVTAMADARRTAEGIMKFLKVKKQGITLQS